MKKRLTDEEIIKKQERLYELECDCSTGPFISSKEQEEIIKEYLKPDFNQEFRVKIEAKIQAREKELVQEIAMTSDPRQKKHLQQNLALLSDV